MKKALLVDTNFSAKPIYDFLINNNVDVYVVGSNSNDTLARFAHNYIHLDYTEIEKLYQLVLKFDIDYLIPGGNDISYKVCSEISSKYNFYNIDSPSVTELVNNKKLFRKISTELGLHIPKAIEISDISNYLPVIIKPVDAYSGHGITIIYENSSSEIENAINNALNYSKSKNYLIEEYITGQLYSHSAFIKNGNIVIDFIVEENCTINQFTVNTSRVINNFNPNILKKIQNDITLLARHLKFADGLIHTQFICDGNRFWLIEITRRCPGDLYSKLIELSTGINYAEYYTLPFINESYKPLPVEKLKKRNVIRHTITVPKPTNFFSIKFEHSFDKLECVQLAQTGDLIKESPFGRIGIIFGTSNNLDRHTDMWAKTLNHELYSLC